MLMITSQRRAEVASMKWSDINFENKLWHIDPENNKSNRIHVIPLSNLAIDVISEMQKFRKYVFCTSEDTHIKLFSKIKHKLDQILSKKYTIAPWRIHDVRRTVSVGLRKHEKISTDLLGRILNHAPVGITKKHYDPYDFLEEKAAALEGWSAKLSEQLNNDQVTPGGAER